MKTNVIAWILIVCVLLSALGELCGWLLPTLSWPFTVSREFGFLSCPAEMCPVLAADGRVQWFGWVVLLLLFSVGITLMLNNRQFPFSRQYRRPKVRLYHSKLGFISLAILGGMLVLAGMDQLLVGKRALVVQAPDGSWYFPAFRRHILTGSVFGLTGNDAQAEADYRKLHANLGKVGGPQFVLMPPIPYDPAGDTSLFPVQKLSRVGDTVYAPDGVTPFTGTAGYLASDGNVQVHLRYRDGHPVNDGASPSTAYTLSANRTDLYAIYYHPAPPLVGGHLLGTDSRGQDIAAALFGGFQVNIKAAVFYLPIVLGLGITIGMLMGYWGGWFDLVTQRIIELLSQLPFLFVVMAVADMMPPDLRGGPVTLLLMALLGWMPITYLVRAAVMREKARDYVLAARALGRSSPRILLRHILPNLVPLLLTLLPFSFAFMVLSLTSLDYLGFGLPDSCASWGRLLDDGLAHIHSPWVAVSAVAALVFMLLLTTVPQSSVPHPGTRRSSSPSNS